RLSAVADRALREVLRLGRRHHFRTVLVLMPESTAFQELYPSPVRAELDAYLGSLSREYQVPLVDARSWAPDDDFRDGHHLLRPAAWRFSERFGREVLRPLLTE